MCPMCMAAIVATVAGVGAAASTVPFVGREKEFNRRDEGSSTTTKGEKGDDEAQDRNT